MARRVQVSAPYKNQQLPVGWEEVPWKATGRIVFVNHIDKRTSWLDPRDNPYRRRDHNELPFGWTLEFSPDLGDYFINHIDRYSTKQDPRNGRWVPYPEEGEYQNSFQPIGHSNPGSGYDIREPNSPTSSMGSYISSQFGGTREQEPKNDVERRFETLKQRLKSNKTFLMDAKVSVATLIRSNIITMRTLEPFLKKFKLPLDGSAGIDAQKSFVRRNSIETKSTTNDPAHVVEAKMQQLQDLIAEQSNELERLRHIEAYLTVDSLDLSEKLAHLDVASIQTLVSLLAFDPQQDSDPYKGNSNGGVYVMGENPKLFRRASNSSITSA